MTFRFSFQKVLDIKEKEKEMAKQEFGTIKHREMELQEQIEVLEMEKQKVFNQFDEVDRKTVLEILEVQQGIDHVNRQMKHLEFQSKQIHHQVELKHQELIERSREAKMWIQWKEKSKEAYLRQMGRKEQAMLDEMAVLRYSRGV